MYFFSSQERCDLTMNSGEEDTCRTWDLLFLQKFLRRSRRPVRNKRFAKFITQLLGQVKYTPYGVCYTTHNILRVSTTFEATIVVFPMLSYLGALAYMYGTVALDVWQSVVWTTSVNKGTILIQANQNWTLIWSKHQCKKSYWVEHFDL